MVDSRLRRNDGNYYFTHPFPFFFFTKYLNTYLSSFAIPHGTTLTTVVNMIIESETIGERWAIKIAAVVVQIGKYTRILPYLASEGETLERSLSG
jgi:hypothetical protein